MVSSINDVLRNNIDKIITEKSDFSIINFLEWYTYKSMKEKDYIIRLILSDFYKVIYFSYDDSFKKYYLEKKENNNISKILTDIEYDYNLLFKALSATIKLNRSTFFDKQMIFEKLQKDSKDTIINNIFEGHFLDKISYTDSADLANLEYLYADYINKSNDKDKMIKIKKIICLKILKIKEEDKLKYNTYMLKFIKTYYISRMFLYNFNKKILLESDFLYLDIIENNNLDDVLEFLDYNIDFFITIVDEYFYYKTNTSNEFKNIIKNFIEERFDDNQKKKFKI